jgi:hypothetical protein
MQKVLNRIGTYGSMICLVHCLCLPIFLSFAPLALTSIWSDDRMEMGLIALSCGFVFVNSCLGYPKHRCLWVFAPLALGTLIFLADYDEHHTHDVWTFIRVGCAGLLLTTSNLWNMKLHKSCETCQH